MKNPHNVTKQDDVVDLFNKVQVEYNEAVTENEELAAFHRSVREAQGSGRRCPGGRNRSPDGATEEKARSLPIMQGSRLFRVKATDVVNIQKSDSEIMILLKAQVETNSPS
ncbi:MAG: hypothetical protein ACLUOI_26325 [Eisenbergiella sp.]